MTISGTRLPHAVSSVLVARGLRGFVDGFVSVLLAEYLVGLGFSPLQVGAIVTGTLLGSAALTLVAGAVATRRGLRVVLVAAAVLMVLTGVGVFAFTAFVPLLLVAVLGTLNPSTADVSAFLPAEQALIAHEVAGPRLPASFARYNLVGALAGAAGALASVIPGNLAGDLDTSLVDAQRGSLLLYAAAGLLIFTLYIRLWRDGADTPIERQPLIGSDRRTVLRLTALFSVDSAGGGFVVTSLLVLWLHQRFDLSTGTTGVVFFVTGILGAASQLLAPRLAARIGLVRTMVFTHLPANAFLILAAFAPNGELAITALLLRALFSQMDVPARQALVMAVVPPAQRAAAASITNVPRSLAAAGTPLLAGALLAESSFGWPLVIAGAVKITYDLVLLAWFGADQSHLAVLAE